MNTIAQYIEHGFALVPIPLGQKGPRTSGWNRRENAITSLDRAGTITGNVGLLHAYSSPLTISLDIDQLEKAEALLSDLDVDLQCLLTAPDAVQICSGKVGRGKLLYRLPDDIGPMETVQIHALDSKEMAYELRCASANGLSVQDVLPPSIHPDTGEPYRWGGAGHWSKIPECPPELLAAWKRLLKPPLPLSLPTMPSSLFKPAPIASPVVSAQTIQHLRSALLHMRSDSRAHWIKVGLALKALGEVGRGLWLEWSATSESYKANTAAKAWDGLDPTSIGYKFVFAEAQRQGWVNPEKRHDLNQEPPLMDEPPLTDVFDQSDDPHCSVRKPEQLPPALKAVRALPVDALPLALRDAAVDMAERLQCPIDYLAVAMLSAAGTIVGNQIGICPLANDESWEVYPCLWGGVVGAPGTKKTPALQAALTPLNHLETQAGLAFKMAYAQYKTLLDQYQVDIAAWKSKKTALIPVEPIPPKPERYVVHDTTYQALGEILSKNPRGVLALSDELSGLLQSLDTQGQEAARGFFLTGWGGTSGYSFDRIGRGSIVLPRYCLSVFGGFQPDRIKGYVQFAQRGSSQNDGLLQRFQLLVWPDPTTTFKIVDRSPNKVAIDAFHKAMLNLDVIAKAPMSDVKPGRHGQKLLHFSPEAQQVFNVWYVQNEHLLASGKMDSSRQSHFSKYRSLIPALALLFHLLDGQIGPVSAESVKAAIEFAVYLKSHANRVYASVSGHDYACTRLLAIKLIDGTLTSGFTCRTVVLKGWSGLTSQETVKGALDALVEFGWLVEREKRSGGRPTVEYLVNAGLSTELLGLS